MIDTNLLRSLLDHAFFEQFKDKLHPSLFGQDLAEIYTSLYAAHAKYGHDLSCDEVMLAWKLDNPVSTRAEVSQMEDVVGELRKATPVSQDMASDAIETLWRRDLGKRIASLGLEMSEGNAASMKQLQRLMEKHADGYLPDDFGDETTQDLDVLLADMDEASRFKFNIETLARHVTGIGRQEFGIIFATPETGKTAFVVSLACAPGGFVDQGASVMILGNEEATKRTVVRAFYAATGMDKAKVMEDPEMAKQIYRARVQGRLLFMDTQDWTLDKIEAYIAKKKPDVVFIDQADKVQIGGAFNAGHERLRELYRRLRETAKRHNCAVIGLSQASAEADGKTRLTYTMMEGSKIGKAAEADLIIGIGKHSGTGESNEPDNVRFLTVSKNKLTGWHGTIICNIQPEISRYVE